MEVQSLLEHRHGSAVLVHGDEDQLTLRHLDVFVGVGAPMRANAHADRHRRPTDAHGLGVQAEHVAHVHRFLELDLLERDRDVLPMRLPNRFDVRRLVHQRQDHAAEDGALGPLNDAALTPPDFTTDPPVASILAFDPNLRLPYSEQWNVAVEKSLGPNQTISVTYLGQKSHRLLGMETLRGPNPDFDVVRIERGRAASKYRALQVQFQRRMSRGLQALASYSWSRSTDNSSTDGLPAEFFQVQTLAFDWGLSSFDVKHVFTSGFHYEIPAPSDQGWARGVFGNWSFQGILRAQSGTPLTVTTTIFDFTTFLSRTVRPDIVPGEPLWIPDSTVPNGRRLNINAFAEPLSGQGNHQRNSIRQFGYWQADTAINRDFVLTEGLRLQLGFEAFNVFNHPNFGEISSALDVPSFFGTPFGTLATSLGGGGVLAGLSPVYQIGGTRSIQINLKLKF